MRTCRRGEGGEEALVLREVVAVFVLGLRAVWVCSDGGGETRSGAWLEPILTAIDLFYWTKLIAFEHLPSLAKS